MAKRWQILPRQDKNIVNQLLLNRQIDLSCKDKFLYPDFEKGLHDPWEMPDMDKAVARIILAHKVGEKIGIFGDYDTDGMPGSVLLQQILTKINLKTAVYIPNRTEGYGLNEKGIKYLKRAGCKVLITVDCGIVNFKEIQFAKKAGFDVIVSDHHEPQERLPDALAVVNPKRSDSHYPFKALSGTGVVYKLIQALSQKFKVISLPLLKWSLDLVAISTICDVVPLLDENRVFAKYGLIVLKRTKRVGLRELYRISKINPQNIDPYAVGFLIGPRLNAPGRLESVDKAFELLKTDNVGLAGQLASYLNHINIVRQKELERVLEEAEEQIKKRGLAKKKVIMVMGKEWPRGIIGLVAGKLKERYSRPAIVLQKGDVESSGSARSIEGFHLVEILSERRQFLSKFGGHAAAAGLSLTNAHLENLYDYLLGVAEKRLCAQDLIPKILIDLELPWESITPSFYEQIEKFEPHGLGNPRPIFLSRSGRVEVLKAVGAKGQHLKMQVNGLSCIGFDLGDFVSTLRPGDKVDLVYTLSHNSWQDTEQLQLKILDLKPATKLIR